MKERQTGTSPICPAHSDALRGSFSYTAHPITKGNANLRPADSIHQFKIRYNCKRSPRRFGANLNNGCNKLANYLNQPIVLRHIQQTLQRDCGNANLVCTMPNNYKPPDNYKPPRNVGPSRITRRRPPFVGRLTALELERARLEEEVRQLKAAANIWAEVCRQNRNEEKEPLSGSMEIG